MKFYRHFLTKYFFTITIFSILSLSAFFLFKTTTLNKQLTNLQANEENLKKKVIAAEKELYGLKNQDQYVINKKLEQEINNIENTYQKTVILYEKLIDLKIVSKNTNLLDKSFTQSLGLLSKKDYASAEAILTALEKQINEEKSKIAATSPAPLNIPSSNTPPGGGYSRQTVQTDMGTFTVDIIAADVASTRVIVDTASDNDCKDNCPVLSLADYVSRSGAYAGINGSYFCPTAYPSCAGKTNSFDLLVMNKNKHYFNSDNNVYSTNPAVIFSNDGIRFVSRALEWGRDTSVNGVLSNFPLLVSGGNIVYSDNPDPKFNSKGTRDFVANKGNAVYIGVIFNATMGDSARVLKTLGVENAMNLDEGGSTALWHGGYKVGPGRNIPNAILFVRK